MQFEFKVNLLNKQLDEFPMIKYSHLTNWSPVYVEKCQRLSYSTSLEGSSDDYGIVPNLFFHLFQELHSLHETELKLDQSFVENLHQPMTDIDIHLMRTTALSLLQQDASLQVEYIRNMKSVLFTKWNGLFLFRMIMLYYSALEEPLFCFTDEVVKFCRKHTTLQVDRPPVSELKTLLQECIHFSSDKEESSEKGKSAPGGFEKRILEDDLLELIHRYYGKNNNDPCPMAIRRKIHNKFATLVYKDMKTMESPLRQYLMRFTIRNLIHIVRRYVSCALSSLKRKQRQQRDNKQYNDVPRICNYAIMMISEATAPSLIALNLSDGNLHPEESIPLECLVMANVLGIEVDKTWFPHSSAQECIVLPIEVKCHEACLCAYYTSKSNV